MRIVLANRLFPAVRISHFVLDVALYIRDGSGTPVSKLTAFRSRPGCAPLVGTRKEAAEPKFRGLCVVCEVFLTSC